MLQKAVSRGYRKPAVNIKVLQLELFIDCFFFNATEKIYCVKNTSMCMYLRTHLRFIAFI